jgi:hypothetical protein
MEGITSSKASSDLWVPKLNKMYKLGQLLERYSVAMWVITSHLQTDDAPTAAVTPGVTVPAAVTATANTTTTSSGATAPVTAAARALATLPSKALAVVKVCLPAILTCSAIWTVRVMSTSCAACVFSVVFIAHTIYCKLGAAHADAVKRCTAAGLSLTALCFCMLFAIVSHCLC